MAKIEDLTGRRIDYVFDETRPGDQMVYVSDYGKLQRDTGWKPEVSPTQALKKMYDWWKRNRALFPAPVLESVEMARLQELPRTA